ncbi:type II secretion system protein [Ruficoccus amylovorans]|uniref:Type II secretion system protein n=1 Tax=Ruficoccus amylovorans TaxID=1804625 RepID=A0A842HFY5_9BACT|nr:type II secretion system protein [Ruficoccus amylovorans]MBC2595322.1 type II secretion system protein [Ruficoccus amylovorans]
MPPRLHTPLTRRAFSLIELLVVVAILGLLSGILFSVLTHVRTMSAETQCASNLRELSRMASLQSMENGGWVPQARWYDDLRAARPNLRDYGLTEELIQCPATELPLSYGININLVAGSSSGAQWGAGDVQFWQRGRYKIAELDPVHTLLFADTFGTTTGYYVVNDLHADYRHSGKMQASFIDGHVEKLTAEDLTERGGLRNGIPN